MSAKKPMLGLRAFSLAKTTAAEAIQIAGGTGFSPVMRRYFSGCTVMRAAQGGACR